jgi:DNA adenine methylase
MSDPVTVTPWAVPLLRWAGSKRKLISHLLKCAPDHFNRYIEPFAGSACLFFALNPKSALLGDINSELLQTYDVIRRHPVLVRRQALSFRADSKTYYRLRMLDPQSMGEISRAAVFVYLNRHCFNGVYRTNAKGRFNVPIGSRTGVLPAKSAFLRCAHALRKAKLLQGDFESCVAEIRRNDFAYLDPPYAVDGSRWRGEYGCNCFKIDDVERLAEGLRTIELVGATFVLSYADCQAIRKATRGWHSQIVSVRRHVAGFDRHRRVVRELLISNRPLPALN